MQGSLLEERLQRLWKATRRCAPALMADYADARWEYDNDQEAVLTILCWGPWNERSQEALIRKVLGTASRLGKTIDRCSLAQLSALAAAYRFRWQQTALRSLATYLKKRRLNLRALRHDLRQQPPLVARGELQIALGMASEKIVDCLMRDWLVVDAFPIDSRVERVLEQYGIPASPPTIVALCAELKVPVRVFARAVWDLADRLSR